MAGPADLLRLITRAEQVLDRLDQWLPQRLAAPDWSASTAYRYRRRSHGGAVLEPVRHVAQVALDDLVEVEAQKDRLVRNTRQFVHGLPANNVLLTGSRGTGKSSLIKACLNATRRGAAADRGRQGRPRRPARHRRPGRRLAPRSSSCSATTCRSRRASPATRR
jgi:predicted AAA+ superfamily ATPase